MLDDGKESSIGAGAILGSLGLGGGGNGESKTAKLLELGKTRKVLGRVLFDSVEVNGKVNLLANHLIDIYDYHAKWEGSSLLDSFYFTGGAPKVKDFTGNMVFKQLHYKLIQQDEGLIELEMNELSGLFKLQATTINPKLSITLANKAYAELSEYFVETWVSGKKRTLTQLAERADSVKIVLDVTEARLARLQDRSSGVLLRKSTIKEQELNRQLLILNTMYAEIVKNKETTAFFLENKRPVFNLIDEPLEPLRKVEGNWILSSLIGGVLGIILVGCVFLFTKMIQDVIE
jgi:hypothetical protein